MPLVVYTNLGAYMGVSRRTFVKTVGRASTLGLGGLALAARGSEAATGWLARGDAPAKAPASLVRLDSNENPVGPAPAVIEAVQAAMSNLGRYPRFMGPDLVNDLARFHATTPDRITLGSGSGEILRMAVDAFTSPTRGLVTAIPTFESPAARARQLGHPLVEVPVDQRTLQIDLDGIAARAGEAGLIFLCNPNNPTGALQSAKAMREFVATVRRTAPQAVIMLDEAYHDYVEDASYESLLPLAMEDPNIFITRTFSKAYGLAGIRLGYAVGKPETMKKLAEYRLGNSVNMLAFAAGRAAIAAASMIPAERARNTAALAFTSRLFGEMGFTVVPSHANFVFADIRRDAKAFQAACREQGVMVGRPFPPFTTWTRVSIGTMDEMQRAAKVFTNILGGTPSAAAR